MIMKLNWLGIHVADFGAALHFYTRVLGMNATDIKPDWAYIETTGMTFELFGGGESPGSKPSTQTVRPSIQVADLRTVVAELRQRGVEFSGEIEQTGIGERIEFIAAENMRWTLVHAPDYPYGVNLNKPHIGWIDLKVEHLTEQQAFYTEVFGMESEIRANGQVILKQGPGGPLLFLEPGGEQSAPFQIKQNMLHPLPSHLMSVETDHIEEAAHWLKSRGVAILTEITRKTWGGIDFYIVDPDGNPIQIVQYIQT
jgi:predicted enzyme related to lactoylglutathione lyase